MLMVWDRSTIFMATGLSAWPYPLGAAAWYKICETGKPHEARSPGQTAFGRHRRSHRSRRSRARCPRVAVRHRLHRADLSGEPEISDRAQYEMISEPHLT